MDRDVKNVPVAVPWYTEEGYSEILKMVPPAESDGALPYRDWVKVSERNKKEAQKRGAIPIRVPIDPHAVKMWCEERNVPVCRKSISAYGIHLLATDITLRRKN